MSDAASREATPLREVLASLSHEKRALLERRLMALGATREPLIPRAAAGERGRLSFAQQRLWFLEQLDPGSAVYNIPRAMRLWGPLDLDALRRALSAIVTRHEVLRTAFLAAGGEPLQVIGEPRPVEVPLVDLSGWPAPAGEAEVERLLAAEARRPFDVTRDLLLRGLAIRRSQTDHVLLLVMHHIASDGWSLGVLGEELAALYRAFTRGEPPALAPLPIQYADYAAWQRDWLQGEPLATHLEYWTRRLDGAPAQLDLPGDHPRPAVLSHRGARVVRLLPRALVGDVEALGRREHATLFMTLAAAFQGLLVRYTGQEDCVIGTAIAGRRRVETEPLIGFFVNTLVLRTDLSGDPSFRECLGRVRETALGAYAHQDLPFERLVEALRPGRSLDRAPLVQVLFVLQDASRAALALDGLTVAPVEVHSATAKFDLALSAVDTAEGLQVSAEYSTDLFEALTIERMLAHYQRLLEGAVADPEQPLSRLPLVSPAERHQLLVQCNDTRRDFPRTATLHALVEAQVRRAPDAPAVLAGAETLSYRELDERAGRLARRLSSMGVGPDRLVGVCLERSPDLVVALLGVLKAGGAYLPLDPTYPPERLTFMIEDAAPVALLVHAPTAAVLPATGTPVLDLGRDAALLGAEGAEPPVSPAGGESLAYVVYTSGSTGQPKGVAVPHRAVTRLVVNADYVALGPDAVLAQLSNVCFDAATFEIWGALVHGARLVILPREVVLSPRDLALALDRHGVTTLFLTTALFNQVAREAPGAFRRVRDCLVGGETLDPRWVAEVLRLAPPLRLLNVYGPTETTTFASWHEVKAVPPGVVTIPIGRPIGNTELYVLDRHLCPVPAGVVGELWIGGAGLARGYLNRPALTAERFVSHPFSDEPGARLYRTGDLARRRADGAIEFVGRVDHQVKIRGHRVEPGEVEAALRRHPEVSEALVTARDHPVAGRQLVAYVGIGSGRGPEPAELRAFLRERLPEFMVPAVFVLLDRLPLTANGKVDREALPAPAEGRAPRAERLVAGPRSPLDRLLVQIWEDLLGVSPVGITDDFFDLGGHSLLAVRMVDAVERACGVRPALSALFERATVEHLASALLQADAGARHAPAAAVKASGSRPPFFFLHGDYTGGGLYCRGLASRMEPEQPFWVLHPHGLDGGPVPSSIEAMAADHVRTLRQVVPHGPYLLGGHCNGGLVALEMARQLRQAGEAVPLLVLLDATAPGRWERRLLEALGALGRLRGLDDARLRDVRMWLREIPPRLRERGRYCRTRARLIMRGGAGELMALLGRKLSGRRMPARATPEAPGSQGAGGDDGVHRAYRRAVLRYLPRRYPGRLTVIRCAGTHPDRADLGWSRLADGVEMHVVPGDHFGALTQHAGALGDKLAECLRRALSA